MTDRRKRQRIEVKEGEHTVAAAEVRTSPAPDATAEASLHAASGHVTPGRRASLVDAVMDLPEVKQSTRLQATIPLGDTESLWRLRERTADSTTRPAGSTALVDANIPPQHEPESGQQPDREPPAP
jgi:RecB family exonuclease